MPELEELRYPVGRFKMTEPFAPAIHIAAIRALPAELRASVAGLNDAQLDTPYRDGGWTVRQVVHHMADSHLNSFLRFKLALTEDEPTIKPYMEAAWAKLPDSVGAPIELSLTLVEALHARWVLLLQSLTPADYERRFVHPERGATTLAVNLAIYAWHGRHHVAHITGLRSRMGW